MKKNMNMDLDDIKFYFAETIMAIEELHKHKIVYRDLKLDNIMISGDGHVKLIDFGFAKILKKDPKTGLKKTKTHCGTPAYMAPEVLRNIGYDTSVDIWCLGILLCEMIGGCTPFHHPDTKKMYDNILMNKIKYPKNTEKMTKDLINKILVSEPEMRISLNGIK